MIALDSNYIGIYKAAYLSEINRRKDFQINVTVKDNIELRLYKGSCTKKISEQYNFSSACNLSLFPRTRRHKIINNAEEMRIA